VRLTASDLAGIEAAVRATPVEGEGYGTADMRLLNG
jgi:hypothetical protein